MKHFKYSPTLAVDTPHQTPPARGGASFCPPTRASGNTNLSPTLAEGARGWVKNPHSFTAIAKELNVSVATAEAIYTQAMAKIRHYLLKNKKIRYDLQDGLEYLFLAIKGAQND